jgi:hypothetical protein
VATPTLTALITDQGPLMKTMETRLVKLKTRRKRSRKVQLHFQRTAADLVEARRGQKAKL